MSRKTGRKKGDKNTKVYVIEARVRVSKKESTGDQDTQGRKDVLKTKRKNPGGRQGSKRAKGY